jgi:hypothetical protein
MKKLIIALLALTLSVGAFAKSKNYRFDELKTAMEKKGYTLSYVKDNHGFDFRKGGSHAEVLEYSDLKNLNHDISTAINTLEEKGYRLLPEECNYASGIFVFTNEKIPNYAFVLLANYQRFILLNTGGTKAELEFIFKTLEQTIIK